MTQFDVNAIRKDFPILAREVRGKPLVYLDNGSSAQKPQVVIDAVTKAYSEEYANVHRGLHFLSNLATDNYEGVRAKIARFLGAKDENEIIYSTGSTFGINMVASSWLAPRIEPGDEIILTVMEHHANIIPWHFLRERQGAVLKWIDVDETGALDMAALEAALSSKTKIVAITHMSNVLGTVTDAAEIVRLAHEAGAEVLFDGCQAGVHLEIDVQALGCDYYVLTGHKIYGPTGIGALYGKAASLARLRPFQGGGEMIEIVERDRVTYNEAPHKFEAGTPPILQAIGFGAALDWLGQFDKDAVLAHEHALYERAYEAVRGVNGLTVHGTSPGKGPVLSFSIEGAHPHDLAQILDRYGVAVRAGHHCAQPLMEHLGVSATARASFGIYNTLEEVDAFIEALHKARGMLI